jgi:hypothetical protein
MPKQPLPQRVVTLEDHVSFPDMVNRIPLAARQQAGWPPNDNPHSPVREQERKLAEVGPERLRLMDEAGITVQVLSISGPGAELLPPPRAQLSPRSTTTGWQRPLPSTRTALRGLRTCP